MIFDGLHNDLCSREWSAGLAWRFAQMSAQAYRDCPLSEKKIKKYWKADGCERITLGSQSVLVIWDQTDCVLAFEGSNPTAADWRANANTERMPLGTLLVHDGFRKEYLKVAQPLTRLLEENDLYPRLRLHVTGHSQGGSVAEIAACHRSAFTCYTFGTPKTFANDNYHPCPRAWYHWRSNDIVPHLPVGRGFRHLARLCYVRQKRGAIVEPAWWRLLWLKVTSYTVGDTIADHSIDSYCEALVL